MIVLSKPTCSLAGRHVGTIDGVTSLGSDEVCSGVDGNAAGVEDTTGDGTDDEIKIGVEDSRTSLVDVSITFAEDITGDGDDIGNEVIPGREVVKTCSKKITKFILMN